MKMGHCSMSNTVAASTYNQRAVKVIAQSTYLAGILIYEVQTFNLAYGGATIDGALVPPYLPTVLCV